MQVIWTEPALADLDNVFEYIFQDSPIVALGVIDRIQDGVKRLGQFPEMGREGRILGTRELVIANTSHIVAYRLKSGNVEILAIIHAARKWPDTV